jgi:peptide/nickel transport system substrate-binding protein
VSCSTALNAETPKKGGILKFVVPDEPPSFDGHRETTFALIHPIAPFYSVLIRVDPQNPASTTDFVCDLCTEMPKPTDGGKTYTFKIRQGVKFHDGSDLTAKDVNASFQHIIFPPDGVQSPRKEHFQMVESVSAPDDETFVMKLKYPSGAFMPALASPFHFIYAKAMLDKDPHWFEQNVMGSGPFVFEAREAGAAVRGKRNPNYYHAGLPYLDGFEAIFAKTQSLRVQAIRGDQAAAEFRGLPPKSRDDLVAALGKDIAVQESDWNCLLIVTPNSRKKPFDDVRVRKALLMAIDRWGGSQGLSKISTLRAVGGVIRPGSPYATPEAELVKLPGFSKDIKASREEAKRLLKEAGVPDLKFTLHNRNLAMPYTPAGIFLVDQWRQIGVTVEHKQSDTAPYLATMNAGNHDVAIDFSNLFMDDSSLGLAKYLSVTRAPENRSRSKDTELDSLYDQHMRERDPEKRKALIRAFEKRLFEQAYQQPLLWWHRIVPSHKVVMGWKMSPSHNLGADLSEVWLNQ